MNALVDQTPSSGHTHPDEHTQPVARRRRRGAPGWLVVASLILLSLPPLAFGAFRIGQLVAGAEITPGNARFFAAPSPVVVHILSAAVFALLGAFQFAPGFRLRHRRWHRVAGRLSVVAGLLVALSALWMTVFHPHAEGTGDLLAAFRLLFGSAMLLSIVLAFVAIRRRDVPRHRAWIMRGYAIGLGAGTQMFTLMAGEIVAGPPGPNGIALLHAAAWVINLSVAEWVIRRQPRSAGTARRPRPHRPEASASAAGGG